jgi:hypothetical protein
MKSKAVAVKRSTPIAVFILCSLLTSFAFKQQAPQLEPLTNQDVVRMVKAQLPSDVIISKIKKSRCHFDTEPSVLSELKNNGVPNDVLLAMVNAPYGMPRQEEKPADVKPEAKRPPVSEERSMPPNGKQTGEHDPKLGTSQDIEALKQKAKTFKNSKRMSVVYDRFKDETWVTAGPFLISGTSRYMMTGSMIWLSASFVFKGETLKQPIETMYLTLSHTGKEWQFLTTDEIYLLFDGERVVLEARQVGDVRRGVTEDLNAVITPEVLEKISRARSAELKAGSYVTKLKEEHQQAFRDLLTLSKLR